MASRIPDPGSRIIKGSLAISASGSTAWELLFMQVPFLSTTVEINQQSISKNLEVAEASINLGWCNELSIPKVADQINELIFDQSMRKEMSKLGRQIVDGEGTNRIINKVIAYEGSNFRN